MSANTESPDNEQAMGSYSKDFANGLSTAYNWRKTNFPGRFTNIYGADIYSCLGLPLGTRAATIFGGDLRMCVDPVGLWGVLSGTSTEMPSPYGSMIKDILTGTGGACSLVLGRMTSVVYGVKRDFHRGGNLKFHTALDVPEALPAKVLAGLIAATTLASSILADVYKSNTAWENTLATWGLGGIPNRLLAVLLNLETKIAVATMADEAAVSAAKMLALVENVWLGLKPGVLDAAKKNAKSVAKLAIIAADQAKSDAPDRRELIDGNYTLRAKNIQLTGRPAPGDPEAAIASSTITVFAQGSAAPGVENGTLILEATKQGSLTAGSATVQVVREELVGTVIVNAGAVGTVNILQGLPDLGARMSLSPTGVKIALGAPDLGPSITMTEGSLKLAIGAPDVGASVTLTPLGLSLKFGLWSLNLTEAGIKMTVAENSVSVTPTGILNAGLNLQNKADAMGMLHGANLAITGEAQALFSAPMISIGP